MYNNLIKFEWCIGIYEGERAKSILDHSYLGLGYFIRRSEGSGRGAWVEAAFRRPIDGPTPEHLKVADPMASIKLDKMLDERMARMERGGAVVRASNKTINAVRETLNGKLYKKLQTGKQEAA